MTVHSYLRVSTSDKDQTVENQKLVILKSPLRTDFWYAEEGVSGSVPAVERPVFSDMLKVLEKGDTLIVTALDRLGRDTLDVLSTIKHLEKLGVAVCVLNLGTTDITSPAGKAFIQIIMALAELELNTIRERTRDGMARVKEEGVFVGRPLKITPDTLKQMCNDKQAGLSLDKLSSKYNIPRITINSNIKKWGNKLEEYEVEYDKRQKQYKENGVV